LKIYKSSSIFDLHTIFFTLSANTFCWGVCVCVCVECVCGCVCVLPADLHLCELVCISQSCTRDSQIAFIDCRQSSATQKVVSKWGMATVPSQEGIVRASARGDCVNSQWELP